jgi:hypothetical protein
MKPEVPVTAYFMVGEMQGCAALTPVRQAQAAVR